jgi:hypothetical protein
MSTSIGVSIGAIITTIPLVRYIMSRQSEELLHDKVYYKILNEDKKKNIIAFSLGRNSTRKFWKTEFDMYSTQYGFYVNYMEGVLANLPLLDNSCKIYEVLLYKDSVTCGVAGDLRATLNSRSRAFKTDKLFLQNPLEISDFLEKHNLVTDAIKRDVQNLTLIKNQTEELCFIALGHNLGAIEYINNPTKKMTDMAIKRNYRLLPLIKNQTDEMCMEVVQKDGNMLKHVVNPTHKICKAAVENNCTAMQYVKKEDFSPDSYADIYETAVNSSFKIRTENNESLIKMSVNAQPPYVSKDEDTIKKEAVNSIDNIIKQRIM